MIEPLSFFLKEDSDFTNLNLTNTKPWISPAQTGSSSGLVSKGWHWSTSVSFCQKYTSSIVSADGQITILLCPQKLALCPNLVDVRDVNRKNACVGTGFDQNCWILELQPNETIFLTALNLVFFEWWHYSVPAIFLGPGLLFGSLVYCCFSQLCVWFWSVLVCSNEKGLEVTWGSPALNT